MQAQPAARPVHQARAVAHRMPTAQMRHAAPQVAQQQQPPYQPVSQAGIAGNEQQTRIRAAQQTQPMQRYAIQKGLRQPGQPIVYMPAPGQPHIHSGTPGSAQQQLHRSQGMRQPQVPMHAMQQQPLVAAAQRHIMQQKGQASHLAAQDQHQRQLQHAAQKPASDGQQQYMQSRQLHQEQLSQPSTQQAHFQRGHPQDGSQPHLAHAQAAATGSDSAAFQSQVKPDYEQYPQHAQQHHMRQVQQLAQKDQAPRLLAQQQRAQFQAQQVRLAQQQSGQQQGQPNQFPVGQGITTSANALGSTPAMSSDNSLANGNLHNNHMYQVGIGIPPGAVPASATSTMQYSTASGYANANIFDPLSLHPPGLPVGNAVAQPGQPAPHPSIQQIQARNAAMQAGAAAMQAGAERSGAVAGQELQAYVDPAQQQLMHRQGMQPHAQGDLQGQGVNQHPMSQALYQPIDQSQNAQHLVLGQNAAMVQQQGQVAMQNQGTQLQQHAQVNSQDPQFDQQAYQNAHANQLGTAAPAGLPQGTDAQQRKTGLNAQNQQDLLAWSGNNPGARLVANGVAQQANADMPNMVAPGTLITSSSFAQSQLFDMGVDMRQQAGTAQNGMGQVQQQAGVQKLPQGASVLPTIRRAQQGSATNASTVSPRKRRQVTSTALAGPVLDATGAPRTFSCSGCGRDFARKRDRDSHVRTVHERSFSCNKCHSRFKTKSDANRHIRIVHDRVRPYPCPSCPSMFSERNKLRRHKETVHEKLRPYVCPVCSARFGELGNLRQHTGSLHPDYQVEQSTGRTRVNSQVQS